MEAPLNLTRNVPPVSKLAHSRMATARPSAPMAVSNAAAKAKVPEMAMGIVAARVMAQAHVAAMGIAPGATPNPPANSICCRAWFRHAKSGPASRGSSF